MHTDLKMLIKIVFVSVPVGLFIGIVARKTKPDWCKSYAKFCMNKKWWLFLIGTILFLAISIISFLQKQYYFSGFFFIGSLFELFAIFKYGFRRLTPEEESRIDTSDPRKILPLSFWKQH